MRRKKSPKGPKGSVDIAHPKGVETIVEGAVEANGTCDVPEGYELIAVYGAIEQDPNDLPEDDDMGEYEWAGDVYNYGDWGFPQLYGAQVGDNWVKILCYLEQPDGAPSEPTAAQSFTATERQAKRKKRQTSRPVTIKQGVPIDPEGTQLFFGRWYLYPHLSVTDDHYGNRFMMKGNQLRASQISIFVEDLLWRTEERDSLVVVRKPTGNGMLADGNWRFRTANQYSICVHQARGWQKMVRSTNFLRPTRVPLDSNRPIYVNVNDRRRPSSANGYPDNSGSFNVWVRVDAP